MELIPFFSTAILVATIASIVLAITSYAAYKARERRRPNRDFPSREIQEVTFFHRYLPEGFESTGTDDSSGARDD